MTAPTSFRGTSEQRSWLRRHVEGVIGRKLLPGDAFALQGVEAAWCGVERAALADTLRAAMLEHGLLVLAARDPDADRARIHILAKECGLSEADRRELYARVTGLRSSTDMTDDQKEATITALESVKRWRRELAAAPPVRVDSEPWIEVIERCKALHLACGDLPFEAGEFAASVADKAESIQHWIEENRDVTRAQLNALDNMEIGVARWQR